MEDASDGQDRQTLARMIDEMLQASAGDTLQPTSRVHEASMCLVGPVEALRLSGHTVQDDWSYPRAWPRVVLSTGARKDK